MWCGARTDGCSLACGGFGLAIVTGSPVRTIFAVCLAALLNFKAASEAGFVLSFNSP